MRWLLSLFRRRRDLDWPLFFPYPKEMRYKPRLVSSDADGFTVNVEIPNGPSPARLDQ